MNTDSFYLHDLYPSVVRYSYPLALTTQTCGVYLTILVSVHRFLGVCHPFRTKRWVTRRPVQYAIISSIVFSISINIPTWMELDIEPCYSVLFQRVSRYVFVQLTILFTTIPRIIDFNVFYSDFK